MQQAAPNQQGPAAGRAPKRHRAHRVSQRQRPQDEGPTTGKEHRYSEAERTMMVQAVLKELTPAETVWLRVKGQFPSRLHSSRLAAAYKKAHEEIVHWRRVAMLAECAHETQLAAQGAELSGDETSDDASAAADTDDSDCASDDSAALSDVQDTSLAGVWCSFVYKELTGTRDEDLPQLPPEREPTRDAIKKQAKFWTKRYLQKGDVHDVPPSIKGAKRQRCQPIFAQIREKILRGWKDKVGRWHAYFSLDDLERRDGEGQVAPEDHQRRVCCALRSRHPAQAALLLPAYERRWLCGLRGLRRAVPQVCGG